MANPKAKREPGPVYMSISWPDDFEDRQREQCEDDPFEGGPPADARGAEAAACIERAGGFWRWIAERIVFAAIGVVGSVLLFLVIIWLIKRGI